MEAASVAATGVAEPQQQISDLGRVIGVLTSPSATFADIARKPKWVIPIIICGILSMSVGFAMNQKLNWRSFFTRQMERSGQSDQIPPERKARILEIQTTWAPRLAPFIGPIFITLGALLLSAIFLLAFNVVGNAGTKYRTALAITSHAFLPALISSPLAIVVILLKDYGDVDPENLVASSVGAFLPEGAPRWLVTLGNSFELFWIWALVLIALGFSATNRKRISTAKALAIVFSVWLTWVFIQTSWIALRSS